MVAAQVIGVIEGAAVLSTWSLTQHGDIVAISLGCWITDKGM